MWWLQCNHQMQEQMQEQDESCDKLQDWWDKLRNWCDGCIATIKCRNRCRNKMNLVINCKIDEIYLGTDVMVALQPSILQIDEIYWGTDILQDWLQIYCWWLPKATINCSGANCVYKKGQIGGRRASFLFPFPFPPLFLFTLSVFSTIACHSVTMLLYLSMLWHVTLWLCCYSVILWLYW